MHCRSAGSAECAEELTANRPNAGKMPPQCTTSVVGVVLVLLWMNVERANAARDSATRMLELNPRNDIFDNLEMPPSMQRMGVRRRAEMARMWVAGRRGRRMCNWLKNTNNTTTAPPKSSMRASRRTMDRPVLPAQAVPRSMYVWGVPTGR